MNHKIHSSINDLAVSMDSLVALPGNPRIGNVEAIAASYEEFGQVRPIVVRPNDDGTSTILAGNHQYQAAKSLGWTHIAVIQMDADDARAMAFAIADNRTNELGHTDDKLLYDALGLIVEDYSDLMQNLEWDEFELAIMDHSQERSEYAPSTPGLYEQPIISLLDDEEEDTKANVSYSRNSDGDVVIEAPKGADMSSLVTQGSTSAGVSGSTRAVVQYSLVFDDPDQQRKWYDFLRWLRSDPGVDGETTAAKVINFIENHADF
jgi:hypothetical protein